MICVAAEKVKHERAVRTRNKEKRKEHENSDVCSSLHIICGYT